ncbi:MAG: hypothetical protein V4773_02335, partial [Verrucomicrobiota bacterium]
CVSRLKRLHYAFRRLHEIWIARLTAEPIYELKMAFSHHAYLAAEHVAALRKRVAEMREPPLGLDVVPDPALELFFDEVRAAPDTPALLAGLYGKALPALAEALARYQAETNRLTDAPSVRLCRFAALEVADMLAYGEGACTALVSAEAASAQTEWLQHLDGLLIAAGLLDGIRTKGPLPTKRMNTAKPFAYDLAPKRDERFPDPYNMGVHAEVFLYDEQFSPQDKTLMMFYKRLREIDVPEMMASIIRQTPEKPWGYQLDMTRQLWDEARHAMMGEVGFVRQGIDWGRLVRVNFTWSLALNTQLGARERHSVLYFIEQGLMPKTGKRYEWEVAMESGDPFSTLCQDFDWADEVLHARIGRDWYVTTFENTKEAIEYGDKNWSKVLIDWNAYKTDGRTLHFNWWPDLYRVACEKWGKTPEPHALAYNTSYAAARADLKEIAASA